MDDQELIRTSEVMTSSDIAGKTSVPTCISSASQCSVNVHDGTAQTEPQTCVSTASQCEVTVHDGTAQTDGGCLERTVEVLLQDNKRMSSLINDLSDEVKELRSLHGDISEILTIVRQFKQPVHAVADDAVAVQSTLRMPAELVDMSSYEGVSCSLTQISSVSSRGVLDPVTLLSPSTSVASGASCNVMNTPITSSVPSAPARVATPASSRVLFEPDPMALSSSTLVYAEPLPLAASSPTTSRTVSPRSRSVSGPSLTFSHNNSTTALDPIQAILQDPFYEDMQPEKACTRIAGRMADVLFGPEVLAASNLTGRDNLSPLNSDTLLQIHNVILRQYGHRLPENIKFSSVWRRCRESIGAKCKHYRSKKR